MKNNYVKISKATGDRKRVKNMQANTKKKKTNNSLILYYLNNFSVIWFIAFYCFLIKYHFFKNILELV